jgi:uncharacterized membrane protein YcaP (DUF421 family)
MTFLVGDAEGTVRTVVVGILAYVALVAILRVSGKRTLSKMNAFDLVVTVALGSTLATILLSRDVPLTDGVIAFLVLVGMQFLITWSSVRWRWAAQLAKSEPRALVYQGRVLDDALRDERVVRRELEAAVRQQGLVRPEDADLVVLETDGTFSVIATLDARPPDGLASQLPAVAGTGAADVPAGDDRGG